jgi:hypothetical protein
MNSRDAVKKWIDAERKRDKYVKVELTVTGRASLVPSGTRVVVLETGTIGDAPISKVRILEGKYSGLTGWVADKEIRRN